MSDTIKLYIERVERLRTHRDTQLNDDDLRNIARELGMSEADLAAVDAEIQDRCNRGQRFAERSLWDDAVRELGEALILAPNRVDLIHALAVAHHGRYRAHTNASDRKAADDLARRCIDLDPKFQPAYDLLGALSQPAAPKPSSSNTGTIVALVAVVFVGLIAVAVVGVAALLVMSGGDEASSNLPSHSSNDFKVTHSKSSESSPQEASGAPFALGTTQPGGLPVELVDSPVARGLVVHVHESRHSVYQDKSFYSYKFTLENRSTLELHEAKGKLTFYDSMGAEVMTDAQEVHGSTDGIMRPGDSAPFDSTIKAPSNAAKVTLEVTQANTSPAPNDYDPGRKLKLDWKAQKPSHIKLSAYERSASTSSSYAKGSKFWKTQFAFVNVGSAPIRTLKVEAAFYDADNKELDSNAWLIAYSGSSPIMPGETWCEGGVRSVPAAYDHYTLRIVEVE